MDRKYPGVTVRGNGIQITFMYKGKRQREFIRCGRTPRAADLKLAWEARCSVLRDIDLGRFNYSEHFPNSSRVTEYGPAGDHITIEHALNEWLKNNQKNWAYSSMRDYISIINTHLNPSFGHLKLNELTKDHVDTWISSLDISNKRINNALTPLRMVFRDAYLSGKIISNPMGRIRNLKSMPRQPEPFSREEIFKILGVLHGQCRTVIHFCFLSGLRTSELIALDWRDVDFPNSRINITKAIVRGKLKETKTRAGSRIVELDRDAIEILAVQRKLNPLPGNIFLDPKSGLHWTSDQPLRKRVWIPALRNAGVKYREQYQMRHTYASRMLSSGKNPLWVAAQLGHADWGMVRKVYGRWIPLEKL
jgi:integrase